MPISATDHHPIRANPFMSDPFLMSAGNPELVEQQRLPSISCEFTETGLSGGC